jgi:RHS repeat-associated protein
LRNDGTFTYEYDNEGNRTARFVDNGDGVLGSGDTDITEYDWDHRNRLTKVTERDSYNGAATQTVEYEYDYQNQLIGRTLDADGNPATTNDITQTKFIYEDGQIVLQFEKTASGNLGSGDLSNRYLWGPAVDQLFADEQVDWGDGDADGEVLWALTDHLGTVRDLIDNSGTLQNHKSYDAFGNVMEETNAAIDTLFGFTGKLFDDATGLQNNLNRWYDANVGRWLSEDQIGFAAGDANLYRYVDNQPINFADPDGLIPRPGRTPPKSWPPPPPGWEKWDPSSGRYNKGTRYRHWHPPDPGHRVGHWDEEDKDGGNHKNVYEFVRYRPQPQFNDWSCLGPFPSGWHVQNLVGNGTGVPTPEPWWHMPAAMGLTVVIVVAPEVTVILPRLAPLVVPAPAI